MARLKQFVGLLEKSVFNLAKRHEAQGRTTFKCRFMDEVKNFGTPQAIEKSRLVAQAYNDRNHG